MISAKLTGSEIVNLIRKECMRYPYNYRINCGDERIMVVMRCGDAFGGVFMSWTVIRKTPEVISVMIADAMAELRKQLHVKDCVISKRVCGRTACRADLVSGSTYFNQSTRGFYCARCAGMLNRENYIDALRLFGGPLCILQEPLEIVYPRDPSCGPDKILDGATKSRGAS